MLLSSLPDTDGSRCILTFDEPNGWLRATWRGFVDMEEAMRGADNYLRQLEGLRCPYLLNDNVALRGPWFDSIDWLEQVWVPQAVSMGLRYVAHVVQADSLSDTITVNFQGPVAGGLELQIFQQVPEAEAWLRICQQRTVSA
ncbi:hypothetical protein [Hymenobacter negativus]|uniref:STAS/SEC14 domain-containing protein n=1 Tax=Hymenobacter negativus TaxID=2795026 RepID=A0ABS3QCV1_9BACT|nr:hypothetical protein [Hymenobacter negativus]MBO2008961.1 hypothetical protein [Hymenobacter negativus]